MAAIIDCPICGNKVEWSEQSKYRPFCSLRCKQIDLGAWADEKYVIPGQGPAEGPGDDDDNKPPIAEQ